MGNALNALSRPPLVNQAVLNAKKEEVEGTRDAFKKLQQAAAELNKAGHDVLTITKAENPKIVEPVPVFPFDAKLYDTYGVPLNFRAAYVRTMRAAIKDVAAVEPPTLGELEIWKVRVGNQMMAEKEQSATTTSQPATPLPPGVEAPPASTETRAAPPWCAPRPACRRRPTVPPRRMVPMAPRAGPDRRCRTDRTARMPPCRGPSTRLSPPARGPERPPRCRWTMAEVTAAALTNLQVLKADSGELYLPSHWAEQTGWSGFEPSRQQMWEAMVYYWLAKDVLVAINKTNLDVVHRASADARPTVVTAAVKRLVELSRAADQTASSSTTGTPYGPGPVLGPAAPTMGPTGPGGPRTGPAAAVQADTLTQHKSNEKYDVVLFNLTIVARASDLPEFLHNLQAQNLYTVLQVDFPLESELARATGAAGATGGGTGGLTAPGNLEAPEEMFYYGPDAVIRVHLPWRPCC